MDIVLASSRLHESREMSSLKKEGQGRVLGLLRTLFLIESRA